MGLLASKDAQLRQLQAQLEALQNTTAVNTTPTIDHGTPGFVCCHKNLVKL